MASDVSVFRQAFDELLNTLNAEQREAVEQTEGPVLVLAGPGTGKTQVLAARIGYILQHTDSRPQNILCLTFTDAGVAAMRRRLATVIGPEAFRIPVMTYHSFCHRVIQDNPEFFGMTDLEPLTELERVGIIRRLLESLPADHLLRLDIKSPYHYEAHLRHFFQWMKAEGKKPGDIRRAADQWVRQLPEKEEFIYKKKTKDREKGSLKTELIADETLKMERLKAAADLFPKYNRLLLRHFRYEFEDMILWTIRAFIKYPELLRNYQERFLYVLVDEYQDTNGAQNELLQLLMSYWDSPNIFIVGDDDQSIFEFQGARLENLLKFYEQHKDGLKVITLTGNYRSVQPVLDVAGHLIDHNTLRAAAHFPLPAPKHLNARKVKGEGILTLLSYPSLLAEDVALLQEISRLLSEGVPASEIAVICAEHKQYERLMRLLEKNDIPYVTRRPLNILRHPLILHLREMLTWLHEEMQRPFSGENRLFRLLHAPFFDIPALELANMAITLRQSGMSWREAAEQSSWTPARELAGMVGRHEYSLPTLMEALLNRTGILSYVLHQPDKALLVQVLSTWMAFVQGGVARNPEFDLSQLLQQIAEMEDNRIKLYLQQNIQTGEGIHLLSAHAAKGLEFEYVFVPDVTQAFWEPDSRSRRGRFPLPPSLSFDAEADAMEARRRLFYVALTRAKRFLQVSWSRSDDAGKMQSPARFVTETGLTEVWDQPDAARLSEAQLQLLETSAKPVITLPDTALFESFLEEYALSAKGLNKYLRCPVAFYYEEILRIPGVTSEAAASGIAMHAALQQYFHRMQREKSNKLPDVEHLTGVFVREMERLKNWFAPAAWQQRLALGQKQLRRYWTEQAPYWRRRARVEFDVRFVVLDDIPLKGVVDKIEFMDDHTLRVVDYKTGKYSKERIETPSENNPLGGDYYRQLLFYKVLLEQSRLFAEPVAKGQVSWITPDSTDRLRHADIPFSNDNALWMKDLIRQTWKNIRELRFSEGCGDKDCAWCQMLAGQMLPEQIARPEEGLDDDR